MVKKKGCFFYIIFVYRSVYIYHIFFRYYLYYNLKERIIIINIQYRKNYLCKGIKIDMNLCILIIEYIGCKSHQHVLWSRNIHVKYMLRI